MKSALVKLILVVVLSMFVSQANAQKVGLLLGSFVSERWHLDQKIFADRITELGGECVIEIGYDSDDQLELADKLIKSGVDVLVVVALDATKASPIVDMAAKAGIPVICYDRLILNPRVTAYISFDNEKVGRMQAEYMVSRFPEGKYLLINGPTTDYNAVLFRKGQIDVLRPLLDSGKITLVNDHVLESWSAIDAFALSAKYFQADQNKPDVVLAANDGIANAVLQSLPPGDKGKIAITGQDADLTAIRNIIAGHQSMTVYKSIRKLANTAADAAMTVASGGRVKGTQRMTAGGIQVNAVLLQPIIVDHQNYRETVVKDGHVSLSEVTKNLGKAFEAERNRIQLELLLKERALEVEKKKNQWEIFLSVLVFAGIMLAGLSFAIYQKHKSNKMLNMQKAVIERKNEELQEINSRLQILNDELRVQKEQIGHQRDAIKKQKEELINVNEIIASQKDEIQHQNESLEMEVHKRTTELTQYIRQLEQYSFVTAHNLRAPVARIIGLAQVIRMNETNPDEAKFFMEKLVESSQELDLVFRELNSILDIRTFSMEIFSAINFEEEVNGIKENLRYEIDQNQAVIEHDFTAVQTIVSIKPYIHSILFNLITNAIKYREPSRVPVIRIGTRVLPDNRVLLFVTDNGLGIKMQYVDKVFQLYKRFHFHVEGRGIGLFLVKTQVDSLGGKIEIESKVDEGTTINIYLQQTA